MDSAYEQPTPQLGPPLSRAPTGTGVEPLNIVILGASYAGLACAHHFLDHTINKLRTVNAAPSYRLVLINPSTHLYWNIAAPRAIASPASIAQDELFIPIEPAFHRQRAHHLSIVQGEAVSLDPIARTITVELIGSKAQKRASVLNKRASLQRPLSLASLKAKEQTISYHAVILATGTAAHSDLLTLHGPHLNTLGALNAFHSRVVDARTIVIGGAGPSAVEIAAQLARHLDNGRDWSMRKRSKPAQRITIITASECCLPSQKPKTSRKAAKKLMALGVDIKYDTRIASTKETPDSSGRTLLALMDGTLLTADVYVPCTGVEPNTSYLPDEMKDNEGYVLTDPATLRIDCPIVGERTYAIGDVASYSRNTLQDIYAAVPVLMHNLLNDLLAHELRTASLPKSESQRHVDGMVDARFVQKPLGFRLWPMTRFGGVGTWRDRAVPGWMVYLLKGRRYRIGKRKRVVEFGKSPYPVKVQKA